MHQQVQPSESDRRIDLSEASRYPISQLIAKIIRNTGYTPFGFLLSIGHPNTEAVLPDLESWLQNGVGYESTIALVAAFDRGETDNLEKAAAESAEMKAAGVDPSVLERTRWEQAVRDRFRPFIHADGTQTRPSGITIFGLTGGHERWHNTYVPGDILKLPLEEQLQKVPELMAAYKRKYNGFCPFFGFVSGFKFVCWSEYFQFDADGQLLERVEKTFHHAEAWVELR